MSARNVMLLMEQRVAYRILLLQESLVLLAAGGGHRTASAS